MNHALSKHLSQNILIVEMRKKNPEIARENWKDSWFALFDSIKFNQEEGRVFCKICKKHGGKNVFSNVGFVNVKIFAFQDDGKSEEHKNYVWVD